MENNQHINNFDAMLKQSLEGTQMPVPSGVWESVGSSIGAKTLVAAKVASLKLIILKAVAGVILASSVGYGIYELTKTKPDKAQNIDPVTDNQSTTEAEIAPETIYQEETTPENPGVYRKEANIENLVIIDLKPEPDPLKVETVNSETESIDNKESKIVTPPVNSSETPKTVESPLNKENPVVPAQKEIEKPEDIFSARDILIPNVFTPNDLDGSNDCFKITIENESLFILQIYDNENRKVFETTDKGNCWNGKNMNTGQMCAKGVYSYKLIYELKTGYKGRVPGKVTLL